MIAWKYTTNISDDAFLITFHDLSENGSLFLLARIAHYIM